MAKKAKTPKTLTQAELLAKYIELVFPGEGLETAADIIDAHGLREVVRDALRRYLQSCEREQRGAVVRFGSRERVVRELMTELGVW